MSDQAKKYEPAHPLPSPKKASEGQSLPEASTMRDEAAAADKSKRESGKDKEHHKR